MDQDETNDVLKFIETMLRNRDYYIEMQITNAKLGLSQNNQNGHEIYKCSCKVDELLNAIKDRKGYQELKSSNYNATNTGSNNEEAGDDGDDDGDDGLSPSTVPVN